MRIVNLQEFLKLPAWTMYRKYTPCYTEDLLWKQDSLGERDFVYVQASMPDGSDSGDVVEACEDMQHNGASYPLEDWSSRDGMFKDEQLFMIYEKEDIEKVLGFVQNALSVAQSPVETFNTTDDDQYDMGNGK